MAAGCTAARHSFRGARIARRKHRRPGAAPGLERRVGHGGRERRPHALARCKVRHSRLPHQRRQAASAPQQQHQPAVASGCGGGRQQQQYGVLLRTQHGAGSRAASGGGPFWQPEPCQLAAICRVAAQRTTAPGRAASTTAALAAGLPPADAAAARRASQPGRASSQAFCGVARTVAAGVPRAVCALPQGQNSTRVSAVVKSQVYVVIAHTSAACLHCNAALWPVLQDVARVHVHLGGSRSWHIARCAPLLSDLPRL